MPRGKYWYGPGFWKRGTGWTPGSGGFRGGANPYVGPVTADPGWAPCFYWGPSPDPQEQARELKQQADHLRAKLRAIEERLAELEKKDQ